MRKLPIVLFVLLSTKIIGWGVIGHRTVGLIAEDHLSKKANQKVTSILGGQSLAYVSTWMDEIRSDSLYRNTYDWHWVTIPDSLTYESVEKNPKGDIIQTISRLISELKTHALDSKTEAEHIKMLAHLVGDIHQPLHVGTGNDTGGNAVRVKWFGQSTNLHSVWDGKMIDSKQFSYTELAHEIDHATPKEIREWQSSNVSQWARESMELRSQVYDLPENSNMGYEYRYRKWYIVEKRLLQAGIRLAGILNEIYG